MSERLVLDAGPLSRLCSPHQNRPENRAFREHLVDGAVFCLPEIADYEVRRGLLRIGATSQLRRLDGYNQSLLFLPLSRDAMLIAAKLWAEAQKKGIPTSDPRELDCDVILAAQALVVGATVITENSAHISRFTTVADWRTWRMADG